ncbi:MAG TPA: YidC/Oxa1 family membrane protein insertase [Thermoleophilaceae bacterium]|jgi:YidC/Oxa1 family membrane protein insertase|nr:YidC/Oxa1 family membrane protein insertase [Thermoleophilaceae bacterium]
MILPFATFIQPLVDLNDAILKFWHNDVGFSWGLSIIFLTFVIRAAILPLTFRQVRSMQALQRLQPEMKRIQERYKGDKQRQQQEMMKFYQVHGVNPLASCLPLVLQLPFFFSLFYLLRSSTFKADIAGEESFLFIPNLAKPLTGHPAALAVMIVLYVGTQLASSLLTAMSADPNQRRLMLALPFVFVIFVFRFQAGLLVYWVTTNVWTIGQQLAIKRFLPPPEPLPEGAVAVAKGGGSGGDGGAPTKRAPKPKPDAPAAANSGGDGNGAAKAPPPSPRKKKKRSGRRR